jgi:U3 small nucleolar RNA-associated protein 13
VPPAASTAIGPKRPLYFATAGDKGAVRVWRSDTATCVYQPPAALAAVTGGPNSEAADLRLLPGGRQLLLSTSDCRLLLLSPEGEGPKGSAAGLAVAKQLIGNNDEVTDVRFLGPAEAPTHLAVATNSEVIRLFELAGMSCAASLTGHRDIVLCLDTALLPAAQGRPAQQQVLVSGSKDNEVRVWHVGSGACLAVGQGHLGSVSAVSVAPKARQLMVSAAADKLLKVWDLAPLAAAAAAAAAAREAGSAAPAPLQLRALAATAAHDKEINCVAVAPGDALVASASQDRTIRLWQLPHLVPTLTLRGHKRGVWSLAFSPVDQALLSASGDRTLKLWSLQDGACLKTFEGHTGSVLRCAFATAGTQVREPAAAGRAGQAECRGAAASLRGQQRRRSCRRGCFGPPIATPSAAPAALPPLKPATAPPPVPRPPGDLRRLGRPGEAVEYPHH